MAQGEIASNRQGIVDLVIRYIRTTETTPKITDGSRTDRSGLGINFWVRATE